MLSRKLHVMNITVRVTQKKLKPPAAYITQDKQGKLNPIILQRYFVYYITLVLDIFDVKSTV